MSLASRFEPIEIILSADRFADDKGVNITPITVEININENLFTPYLTGDISILDDNDMFAKLNLSGTERVKFTFKSALNDNIIEKNFIITDYSMKKSNDNVSLMVCNMIEDYGFLNGVKTFSKAYTGQGENIIEKILKDQLGKQLTYLRPTSQEESAQSEFRYIVPYLTPFSAINNILAKITTDRGLPFFLYSSLNRNDIVLKSMETILQEDTFNETLPFTFSQAVNNKDKSLNDQLFNLDTFASAPNSEDTISLARKGAIGAQVDIIDITSGLVSNFHTDITAIVEELVRAGVTTNPVPLVDTKMKPDVNDDTTINNYNSRIFSLATAETFPLGPLGYNEEAYLAHHYLKVIKQGVLQHLLKNVFRVSGPGSIMTDSNIKTTVGNMININVLTNKLVPEGIVDVVDPKRSGNFIILSKRYQFDIPDKIHSYIMDVSRISNLRTV